MDETDAGVDPGLSDQYRKASPWPLFVALGLVVSEVGVILGVAPVAVGGLLLFGGAVAGILTEAGYVERPWPLLAGIGVLLLAGGGLVVATQLTPGSPLAAVRSPNGVTYRGLVVVGTGAVLATAGAAGTLLGPGANR